MDGDGPGGAARDVAGEGRDGQRKRRADGESSGSGNGQASGSGNGQPSGLEGSPLRPSLDGGAEGADDAQDDTVAQAARRPHEPTAQEVEDRDASVCAQL